MIGGVHNPEYGLDRHGIENTGQVFWSPTPPILCEEAIKRKEGFLPTGGLSLSGRATKQAVRRVIVLS